MFEGLSDRAVHLRALLKGGRWARWAAVVYAVVALCVFVWANVRGARFAPHLSAGWWFAGAFGVLAVWIFESSFSTKATGSVRGQVPEGDLIGETSNETKEGVRLTINDVFFDQADVTELCLDFSIANSGPKAIVKNWRLTLAPAGTSRSLEMTPRSVVTDRIVQDIYGSIVQDELPNTQVDAGGERSGRLGFRVLRSAFDEIGPVGGRLELRAEDDAGRKINAVFRCSSIPRR